MSRKKSKRPRHPPVLVPQPREKPVVLQTEIGSFVRHPDDSPALRYYLFRPDDDERAVPLPEEDGQESDWQERERRARRYGELWLAHDRGGFSADLYLDREIVSEDEVETLCQGVCDFLDRLPVGPDGGALGVFWMQEIALYDFGPGE